LTCGLWAEDTSGIGSPAPHNSVIFVMIHEKDAG
jgi:hypothetical protein